MWFLWWVEARARVPHHHHSPHHQWSIKKKKYFSSLIVCICISSFVVIWIYQSSFSISRSLSRALVRLVWCVEGSIQRRWKWRKKNVENSNGAVEWRREIGKERGEKNQFHKEAFCVWNSRFLFGLFGFCWFLLALRFFGGFPCNKCDKLCSFFKCYNERQKQKQIWMSKFSLLLPPLNLKTFLGWEERTWTRRLKSLVRETSAHHPHFSFRRLDNEEMKLLCAWTTR